MKNKDEIEIKTFSVGLPQKVKVMYGQDYEMDSAICKQAVDEAYLATDGFRGDGVADLRYHGGPDRAVCVYPYEHYALWEKEINQKLPSAAFGENLTLTNMLEKNVCIGDIYKVGDAIVQIAQGRVPCSTITKRLGNPILLKKMVQTGFTGYLCRVLEEGTVRKDSRIELILPHPKKVSIHKANEIYYHQHKDVDGIKEILTVEELASEWREELSGRLKKLTTQS